MVDLSMYVLLALDFIAARCQTNVSHHWAHGVVVSHPLRMQKALGSNPSVSMFGWLALTCPCCEVSDFLFRSSIGRARRS